MQPRHWAGTETAEGGAAGLGGGRGREEPKAWTRAGAWGHVGGGLDLVGLGRRGLWGSSGLWTG